MASGWQPLPPGSTNGHQGVGLLIAGLGLAFILITRKK